MVAANNRGLAWRCQYRLGATPKKADQTTAGHQPWISRNLERSIAGDIPSRILSSTKVPGRWVLPFT